jgi:cobaltochelatase CobT
MIKGQSRYEHAQKRGKISPKSLYRTAQGGEAARKVFKKKQVNNMLDTAVTVLMDCSGSMGNHKFTHAGQSLILLNDAIAPLGLPLEMLGFTTRGSAPKHGIFKSFGKRVSQEQLMLNVSAFAASGMNSNSDGESLLFAYDRLLRQDTQRKILLVLSDGQPACGYGDSMGHTIAVVKDIEKQGRVELCSIGILDDTVERIYSNWRVINNSSDLEGAVLGVIKDHIISYS